MEEINNLSSPLIPSEDDSTPSISNPSGYFAILGEDDEDIEMQLFSQEMEKSYTHLETRSHCCSCSILSTSKLELLSIYYRVFSLLGEEINLARVLVLANIFISFALLAVPILFGKVIDSLNHISSTGSADWFHTLLPLLIAWASFAVFGIISSVTVAYYADRLAHRRRHVALIDFYRKALQFTPLSCRQDGKDSGSMRKIMDQGVNSLFSNWLDLLRTELAAMFMIIILIPYSFYVNFFMAWSLLFLCILFFSTIMFVHRKAFGLQEQANEYYRKEGSLAADTLSNVALVQSYDIVEDEVARMQDNSNKLLSVQFPVLR